MEHELLLHPDTLMKILRGSDIRIAKTSKRLGIVYGCQDTTMLEGDLKNLAVFKDLGVRICQPTYNVRNLMGDGCIEKADGGLSKLGYDFVAEMNRLRLSARPEPCRTADHRGRHRGFESSGRHYAHRLPHARGLAAQHPRFRIARLG